MHRILALIYLTGLCYRFDYLSYNSSINVNIANWVNHIKFMYRLRCRIYHLLCAFFSRIRYNSKRIIDLEIVDPDLTVTYEE